VNERTDDFVGWTTEESDDECRGGLYFIGKKEARHQELQYYIPASQDPAIPN